MLEAYSDTDIGIRITQYIICIGLKQTDPKIYFTIIPQTNPWFGEVWPPYNANQTTVAPTMPPQDCGFIAMEIIYFRIF